MLNAPAHNSLMLLFNRKYIIHLTQLVLGCLLIGDLFAVLLLWLLFRPVYVLRQTDGNIDMLGILILICRSILHALNSSTFVFDQHLDVLVDWRFPWLSDGWGRLLLVPHDRLRVGIFVCSPTRWHSWLIRTIDNPLRAHTVLDIPLAFLKPLLSINLLGIFLSQVNIRREGLWLRLNYHMFRSINRKLMRYLSILLLCVRVKREICLVNIFVVEFLSFCHDAAHETLAPHLRKLIFNILTDHTLVCFWKSCSFFCELSSFEVEVNFQKLHHRKHNFWKFGFWDFDFVQFVNRLEEVLDQVQPLHMLCLKLFTILLALRSDIMAILRRHRQSWDDIEVVTGRKPDDMH